jgi:hypothetical protein
MCTVFGERAKWSLSPASGCHFFTSSVPRGKDGFLGDRDRAFGEGGAGLNGGDRYILWVLREIPLLLKGQPAFKGKKEYLRFAGQIGK